MSAQSRRPQLSRRVWIGVAVATLGALVTIAYSTSLDNGFVWDDGQQIVMNPDLQPDAPWGRLFSSDVWGYKHRDQAARTNYYRPLQMVSYRLTSEVLGREARDFHMVSVAFAFAAAGAAFWIYLKLTERVVVAFAAAALFAVHPVHVEAVDWISALSEPGCTIFVLIAFGLFLGAEGRGPEAAAGAESRVPQWLMFWLSLVMFAGALLWKETAVVFPLLVAGYVICFRAGTIGQRLRRSARLSLPFSGVLVVYLAVRFRVLGFVATRQRIWNLTPVQAGLNGFHLMMMYWWKLIFPVHLNAYYVFSPVRSLGDARALAAIVFVAAAGVAIWYAVRRGALMTFATLWVFVTLLPVMNIYGVGRNVFAERYLFLPSFGFCLLAVEAARAVVTRLPEKARRPVSAVLLGVVLAWFSTETLARNRDWRDDATLFGRTLASSPDAPFVHFMVASTESEDPTTAPSAEAHYLRAAELAESENPPDLLDLSRAYEGLTSWYGERGDYARAREIVRKWRSAMPGQPEMDAGEGSLLLRSGDWQAAEPLLNRAHAARPDDENVLNALGLLAWEHRRNPEEAVPFFTRALTIHTANDSLGAELHNNLGSVYGDLGQFEAALQQFRSAVAISPGDPEYHTNLATALAAMQRYGEAAAEAKSAQRIDPNYAPARALLQQLGSDAARQ